MLGIERMSVARCGGAWIPRLTARNVVFVKALNVRMSIGIDGKRIKTQYERSKIDMCRICCAARPMIMESLPFCAGAKRDSLRHRRYASPFEN